MFKRTSAKIIVTCFLLLTVVGLAIFAVVKNTTYKLGTGKISVVASFYPLYDFTKNIGGEKISVINMTPAGSEPHDFEPSAKSLADAQKADLFVYNGGTLEPWTSGFLESYSGNIVKASNNIDLIHESNGNDPHFWLDPVAAQKIVDNITAGLIKVDSSNKDYYLKNSKEYKAKLKKLDDDFKNSLVSCKTRTIITSHQAFSYLASRYNLNPIPISGLSPDEEPSAGKLAEISNVVKDQNIKYIFFESLTTTRLADTIARETGAKTLVFDPIEGLTDQDIKQGKNYINTQYENLQNLRTALSCE
jgi:zinc transport system substrate-binding protein